MVSEGTVSKGIFYEGFKKGMSEGKSAKERSMQTVVAPAGKADTVESRMVYPASNANTADKMRKPV